MGRVSSESGRRQHWYMIIGMKNTPFLAQKALKHEKLRHFRSYLMRNKHHFARLGTFRSVFKHEYSAFRA